MVADTIKSGSKRAREGNDTDLTAEQTCTLCKLILARPVAALCSKHTFCLGCLKAHLDAHAGHYQTPCPVCRESIQSSSAGLKEHALTASFVRKYLRELRLKRASAFGFKSLFAVATIEELPNRQQAERAYHSGLAKLFALDTDYDFSGAAAFFKLAVDQRHAAACTALAEMTAVGLGVEASASRAAELLATAATLGDTYASAVVGDEASCVKTLTSLAEQGHSLAMHKLAQLLDPSTQPEDIVRWYQRGVEAGDVRSMQSLAALLAEGEHIKEDKGRAAYLHSIAADVGIVESQVAYGEALWHGNGVPANKQAAVEQFRKAADAGNNTAQYRLGFALMYGDGVPADPAAAFPLLEQAATGDEPRACAEVARAYYRGKGVEQDLSAAAAWLKETMERDPGNMWAVATLGQLYITGGEGVDVNLTAGIPLLTTAAEAGNVECCMTLAQLYAGGRKGELATDVEAAMQWYRKAASRNHAPARRALAKLLLQEA